ncbi:MAG: helix-turn-helix domain-containing protein [Bacillota bacterium]
MSFSENKFEEINKTKKLYLKKGSMKRKNLRNEIANAWIRYTLLKNKKLDIDQKLTSKFLYLKKLKLEIQDLLNEFEYDIYLILDSKKVYYFKYNDKKNFFSTGGEISSKTNNDFSVFKSEHLSSKYNNKFTHGFIINRNENKYGVIGIEGNFKNYSQKKIKKIKEKINKFDYQNINKKNTKNNKFYINFDDKKYKLKNKNLPLFLIGKTGTGKERYIDYIKKRNFKEYKIKKINCFLNFDFDTLKNIKVKTLFVFKDICYLNYDNQRKLLKIIDSKLVNNNRKRSSNFNNIYIICETNKNIESIKKEQLLNDKLLTRLTTNKIAFNRLTEYSDKEIISWIESKTNKMIDQNAKSLISKIDWENNFYDLDKFINFINENVLSEVISVKDLPKFILPEKVDILSIKLSEKRLIKRTLKYFDYNIKLSAQSLDISRSTLYRKIKMYDIET